MDQEHIINSFGEVEKQIDRLMAKFHQQDEMIKGLRARVYELEQALEAKSNMGNRAFEEKEEVRARIDNLLAKLNDFTKQSY